MNRHERRAQAKIGLANDELAKAYGRVAVSRWVERSGFDGENGFYTMAKKMRNEEDWGRAARVVQDAAEMGVLLDLRESNTRQTEADRNRMIETAKTEAIITLGKLAKTFQDCCESVAALQGEIEAHEASDGPTA